MRTKGTSTLENTKLTKYEWLDTQDTCELDEQFSIGLLHVEKPIELYFVLQEGKVHCVLSLFTHIKLLTISRK